MRLSAPESMNKSRHARCCCALEAAATTKRKGCNKKTEGTREGRKDGKEDEEEEEDEEHKKLRWIGSFTDGWIASASHPISSH